MSQHGRAGGTGDDSGGGVAAWLPIIGGVALGAGLLALMYKFMYGKNKNCPIIDPAKRRWPKEDKKRGWFS